MNLPTQFFTPESIFTLTGAASGVMVICNGLQRAFNFNPRWLGLFLSVGISLLGVAQLSATTIVNWLLGLLNGFLIFATASGINGMGAAGSPQNGAGVTEAPPSKPTKGRTREPGKPTFKPIKRGFWAPWF